MFIKLYAPIRTMEKNGSLRAHKDVKSVLVAVSEIAGTTEEQDGGLWITPVNRDPMNINVRDHYIDPEHAPALLAALDPYIIDSEEKLPESEIGMAMTVTHYLAVELARQINAGTIVDPHSLRAVQHAAKVFNMQDVIDGILGDREKE